jgi:hypothetical protein
MPNLGAGPEIPRRQASSLPPRRSSSQRRLPEGDLPRSDDDCAIPANPVQSKSIATRLGKLAFCFGEQEMAGW